MTSRKADRAAARALERRSRIGALGHALIYGRRSRSAGSGADRQARLTRIALWAARTISSSARWRRASAGVHHAVNRRARISGCHHSTQSHSTLFDLPVQRPAGRRFPISVALILDHRARSAVAIAALVLLGGWRPRANRTGVGRARREPPRSSSSSAAASWYGPRPGRVRRQLGRAGGGIVRAARDPTAPAKSTLIKMMAGLLQSRRHGSVGRLYGESPFSRRRCAAADRLRTRARQHLGDEP